jgi:hypothetical protein
MHLIPYLRSTSDDGVAVGQQGCGSTHTRNAHVLLLPRAELVHPAVTYGDGPKKYEGIGDAATFIQSWNGSGVLNHVR